MSTSLLMLIGGAVVAFIGLGVLSRKSVVSVMIGIVLLFTGGGCAFMGWDGMQREPKDYIVNEITDVSNSADAKKRVSLTPAGGGAPTWIYVSPDEMYKFEKGSTVTLTKTELDKYVG